jgi:DNA-binding IclR family transcriptional regulator
MRRRTFIHFVGQFVFATMMARYVPERRFLSAVLERRRDARSVGAPVFNESSAIEASRGLSGTIRQVNEPTTPRIVTALNDARRHRRLRIEGKLRNLRDDS